MKWPFVRRAKYERERYVPLEGMRRYLDAERRFWREGLTPMKRYTPIEPAEPEGDQG